MVDMADKKRPLSSTKFRTIWFITGCSIITHFIIKLMGAPLRMDFADLLHVDRDDILRLAIAALLTWSVVSIWNVISRRHDEERSNRTQLDKHIKGSH